mgnify:CR=1 FL=1
MDFDVLIVGGGAAGMSCALILGSAMNKSYAENKKVGIILHQKTSDLQNALFNNVLGLPARTKGEVLLKDGPQTIEKTLSQSGAGPKGEGVERNSGNVGLHCKNEQKQLSFKQSCNCHRIFKNAEN